MRVIGKLLLVSIDLTASLSVSVSAYTILEGSLYLMEPLSLH